MSRRINFKALVSMAVLLACAKTDKDQTSSDRSDRAVIEAVETQMGVINNATSDINTGNSTAISYLAPAERDLLRGNYWQRATDLINRLFDNTLHALAFDCSSGSVTDTLNPGGFFGTATSGTVTRTWNNCVGDAGLFRRNGNVYLAWSSLSTSMPYIQSGTTLKRATNGLTIMRVNTGNYVEITGNDTANQVNSTNANQVIYWTSVSGSSRTLTLSINETRTGKTANGSIIFQHIVTTPTNLNINVDMALMTRTIVSGTIRVHHVRANFDVDTNFNSAAWNIATCQPISGSATVTVSGSRSGSGSIAFNNGTVTFTYEGNSSTLTLPGC